MLVLGRGGALKQPAVPLLETTLGVSEAVAVRKGWCGARRVPV